MFDFYQRRKMKGVLLMPITRILLVIVVLFVAWSALTRYQIASEMAERREKAEEGVQKLRVQKQLLEEKVNYLSDERGIEAEMRRQFDVALPGEEVIVILEEEEVVRPLPMPTSTESVAPWYKFWR